MKPNAVAPPKKWDSLAALGDHFAGFWPWYLAQLAMWLTIFSIGIWAFVLAIISVVFWEKKSEENKEDTRVSPMVIWWRFPKFVLGFFLASIIISVVSIGYMEGDAYDEVLKPQLISPIKTLRTWTFIFTFLCIGLTTRFRELTKFGWPPLLAFTSGVAINVPLGFILSNYVFVKYWTETIQ